MIPVAVYGTLMKDEINYLFYIAGRYDSFQEGIVYGSAIYNTGSFPCMLLNEEDPDEVTVEDYVHVHLFFIKEEDYEEVIHNLDLLEGHPDFYERKKVKVHTKSGEVEAWAYIARLVKDRRINQRKIKNWKYRTAIAEVLPSEDEEELPFAVYGTLRLHQGNYRHYLEGNYTYTKKGILYGGILHMGGCPYLHLYKETPDLANFDDQVVVDVFYINSDIYHQVKESIDRLESHPVAWKRVKAKVFIQDGNHEEYVWIYLANENMTASVRGSDWVDYIK